MCVYIYIHTYTCKANGALRRVLPAEAVRSLAADMHHQGCYGEAWAQGPQYIV